MSMVSIEPKLLLAYQGIVGPKVLKYGLGDSDWVLFCDPKMEIHLNRETIQAQLDSLKDFKDTSHLDHPVLKFLGFTGFIGYEALAFLNGIQSRFTSAIPDGLLFFFQTIMLQMGGKVEVASLIPGREAEILNLSIPAPLSHPTIKNVCVSPSRAEYQLAFDRAKEAIHSGNTYQIKLSIKVTADGCIPALDTFLKLLKLNPSPEALLFEAHGLSLVSSSPETQLLICGSEVLTRPIGGTWRKDSGSELQNFLEDKKELCEHNMLVDLERNDLGRICEDKSVQVKKFCEIEEYSHLYHMVTTIVGKLKPGVLFVLRVGFMDGKTHWVFGGIRDKDSLGS